MHSSPPRDLVRAPKSGAVVLALAAALRVFMPMHGATQQTPVAATSDAQERARLDLLRQWKGR